VIDAGDSSAYIVSIVVLICAYIKDGNVISEGPFIKTIMSEFLYTFSSKQFSQQLEPHKENDSRGTSPQRNEHNIRHIRTKKLKRYEKWFEPRGIRKHLTEHEN
jgi:hypothetical protein